MLRAKSRAIRSYSKKLPALLAKDYGRFDHYTPMQVQRTVERHGLNTRYTSYAMALFATRASFESYHQDVGGEADYEALRAELADSHFYGNTDIASASGFDGAYGITEFGGDIGGDAGDGH